MAKSLSEQMVSRRQASDGLDNVLNGMFGLPSNGGQIVKLSLDCLEYYKDDPFKDRSGIEMDQLKESIQENGLIDPIIVRPTDKPGIYQILAGRRRTNVVKKLGWSEIDAIVRDADDNEAIFIVTHTNLTCRQNLLPSEKAFAYKMQLEAIKRQGKRSDINTLETCAQNEHKLKSRDIVAEMYGVDKNEVQRYIRLTFLNTELLELVDDEKLQLGIGIALSYIPMEQQKVIHSFFFASKLGALNINNASELREYVIGGGQIESFDDIQKVLNSKIQTKPKKYVISLNTKRFKPLLRKVPPTDSIEDLFFEFLNERYG